MKTILLLTSTLCLLTSFLPLHASPKPRLIRDGGAWFQFQSQSISSHYTLHCADGLDRWSDTRSTWSRTGASFLRWEKSASYWDNALPCGLSLTWLTNGAPGSYFTWGDCFLFPRAREEPQTELANWTDHKSYGPDRFITGDTLTRKVSCTVWAKLGGDTGQRHTYRVNFYAYQLHRCYGEFDVYNWCPASPDEPFEPALAPPGLFRLAGQKLTPSDGGTGYVEWTAREGDWLDVTPTLTGLGWVDFGLWIERTP